jgi:hypothetical protein
MPHGAIRDLSNVTEVVMVEVFYLLCRVCQSKIPTFCEEFISLELSYVQELNGL